MSKPIRGPPEAMNRGRSGAVSRANGPFRIDSPTQAVPLQALTDEQDVRKAYAAHGGEMYGFALRSLGDAGLAEEAVQEAFLRAWRAGNRFDPEVGSMRTWLCPILRNAGIALGRARAARPACAAA